MGSIKNRSQTRITAYGNEIINAADYNGTTTYTHDAWGRTATEVKNGVTKTYGWTSANLLGAVNSSDPNETDVAYTYTGDLKRLWRWENGSISDAYQWDAGFNVLNEARVGEPMKTYVPGLAEVIGNDLDTSADYRYLTHDHLGSTRGMWDGSIGNLGTWEFTPYGAPFNFNGPPDVTQLYTGHDRDRATGQYYAPFRYLDPAIGRWIPADPLGMIDGTNMYAYVRGNPSTYYDPLGLWIFGGDVTINAGCGPGGMVGGGYSVDNDGNHGFDWMGGYATGNPWGKGAHSPGVGISGQVTVGTGKRSSWAGGGRNWGFSLGPLAIDLNRSNSGDWSLSLGVGAGLPPVGVHINTTGQHGTGLPAV